VSQRSSARSPGHLYKTAPGSPRTGQIQLLLGAGGGGVPICTNRRGLHDLQPAPEPFRPMERPRGRKDIRHRPRLAQMAGVRPNERALVQCRALRPVHSRTYCPRRGSEPFARGRDAVASLLAACREQTKPVHPRDLGVIGSDHLLEDCLVVGGAKESFRYRKRLGVTSGEMPYAIEAAFAYCPEANNRLLVAGVNFSVGLRNRMRSASERKGKPRGNTNATTVWHRPRRYR
jgi:hypothetical protein